MQVKGHIENLESREQTAARIYESAEYINDLGQWLDSSLSQFFNHVKNIPYVEDPEPFELVSRPFYMLHKRFNLKGLDCKKKAVLMGAWLNAHGIPWRLVAVSERPDKLIHHIFIQAFIDGVWKNIDPTYKEFKLFEPKKYVTYGEILFK